MQEQAIKEPTMRVNVSKAELPVAEGESVDALLQELRTAAGDTLRKALKVDKLKEPDYSYAWAEDVFADAIVLRLSAHGPKVDKTKAGLYQMTWKRDGMGFSFGEPVRVLRKISYVPMKDAPVRKSAASAKTSSELWGDLL